MRTSTNIRPPRPKYVTPPKRIGVFDNGDFIAQPKLNGSCALLEKISDEVSMFSRHGGLLSLYNKNINLDGILPFGGDTILCGEYMNKSKRDSEGKIFNHKFVIFDILKLDGKDLKGSEYSERYDILKGLYKSEPHDGFIRKINDDVFLVESIESDFESKFMEASKIDMYEGLVLKKPYGLLDRYDSDNTNKDWQLKVRKECGSYKF